MSSADGVRGHRPRLHPQGATPVTICTPDMTSAEFAREAHRQSLLIAAHPADGEEQAWIDEARMWTDE